MKKIPEGYFEPAEKQGKVVGFEYDTFHYAGARNPLRKKASVYLPYGYDQNDKNKKYNVFYYFHGYGGNSRYLLGKEGAYTAAKNMIDHMIQNGELEPIIIVIPTLNPDVRIISFRQTINEVDYLTSYFCGDLMPAVESAFHTWLETPDREGLIASREHRGVGGFSLGGVMSWYVFVLELALVKYYLPMSGDCWNQEIHGGLVCPVETSITVSIGVSQYEGCTPDEYKIEFYTGREDVVQKDCRQQYEQMIKNYPELFNDKNCHFDVLEGAVHDGRAEKVYLYNGLQKFFK